MDFIKMPDVRVFRCVKPDKAQALKPLEEAAEVFGAWQKLNTHVELLSDEDHDWFTEKNTFRNLLIEECADVIQATCNLLAALGVDDATDAMRECETRNYIRRRY